MQMIVYKISYKNALYNAGAQPIFYNNYKWNITFKNRESLRNLYNIVHQLYFDLNKKRLFPSNPRPQKPKKPKL